MEIPFEQYIGRLFDDFDRNLKECLETLVEAREACEAACDALRASQEGYDPSPAPPTAQEANRMAADLSHNISCPCRECRDA